VEKIGILIFTDKAKERAYGKHDFFEAKKNWGIKKIVSQLGYEYDFCSSATINEYEHVLVSLTSYYDILNLIRAIPIDRKCKIHVGGPGVNNIRGYLPYIDTAWFGRCDFGEINGIIEGVNYRSLWRKTDDQEFNGSYEVCKPTIEGLGKTGWEEETSVGCKQKCKFCHYSWWNGYAEKQEESYKSGYTHYEDFFQHIDWSMGRILTALDGMTEQTRLKVGKPISYEKIKEKLLETNKIKNREKNITAKIYSIIGYPWEDENEIAKCDITKALNEIGHRLKNPLLLFFHFSHFVPMQKTPMWAVPFNFHNYWKDAKETPCLYSSDNIKLYTGTSTTSPASAAEETIIQRAQNGDYKILQILASKKFQRLPASRKINSMRTELMRFFIEQDRESIPNIKTPWRYR
jgi:hypothetical protein